MGSWVENLLKANYGSGGVVVDRFEGGDGTYCFVKAVKMRHDLGRMGEERKMEVFELLRCKAREVCGLKMMGRGNEQKRVPLIRLTLLMRRGSRAFKNGTAVADVFAKECARVKGCILSVVQSEDLSFCDQVRVMTNTDIVASPHGAQLTNMLFMDRGSSIMEFFPKGWLEHAGIGQYVFHWMANQLMMKHQGAWWDSIGNECPLPEQELECFLFHKDGQVGHNETYFAEWARKVLNQVRISKLEEASKKPQPISSACQC
ncbi:hypothetical protein ACSBR2_012386 [Camellia fascicularis]